jgi:hypothetical protein
MWTVYCHENCINGNLINNSTIKSCKCDEEECLSCLNISENKRLCLKCNNGFYEIENDNYSITDGYVNCLYYFRHLPNVLLFLFLQQ